ncbi:MAG: hypothetical protein EA363_11050 [Balneolaceae bacterium]|nr:MAG: hypothetical protein EA363_11050 [Balneolaceae bacterium]
MALIVASCASSEKMLQRGQYDRAIERSTDRLMKKPNDEKELRVLKEAFELANTFDRERIEFLEMEGREESWIEIYLLYELLNDRQNKVRRLPTQIRNQFTFFNYNEQIIASKASAADVSYRRGIDFLDQGGRDNARRAFTEFERAHSIYPGYEDVHQYLDIAEREGRTHALFVIENNSGMVIPEFFDAEIRKVALSNLNTRWIHFDTWENQNVDYDYFLVLNLTEIAFSPESINNNTHGVSQEIQDGMRYELDENGNVRKDSLGNDIRVPNMVTVSAQITETVQRKAALVAGALDFYETASDQLIRTDNLSVEAIFEHKFAQYSGDRRALSEEMQRMVRGERIPFPSNEAMMMDATQLLKEKSKAIIRANRRVLER